MEFVDSQKESEAEQRGSNDHDCQGERGDGNGEFYRPTALAALPDGGMVVRELGGARFQVFHDLELRKAWVIACVTVARYGDA